MSFQELEETVRRARYDPEKARAEAREQFETAVKSLGKSGAEEIMRTVAKLIPELKLKTVYDFDEAGGQGFSPSVKLIGPDTIGEPEELWRERGYVSSVSHRTLSVSSLFHSQGRISIDLWGWRTFIDKDEREHPGGSNVWDRDGWDYEDPKILAESIFLGLNGLISPEDQRVAAVRRALNLPEKNTPLALFPPTRK